VNSVITFKVVLLFSALWFVHIYILIIGRAKHLLRLTLECFEDIALQRVLAMNSNARIKGMLSR